MSAARDGATVAHVVTVIHMLSEAIRKAGEIPSGQLYAVVMGSLSLEQYERAIKVLKGAGLVVETSSHLLRWVGPKIEEAI